MATDEGGSYVSQIMFFCRRQPFCTVLNGEDVFSKPGLCESLAQVPTLTSTSRVNEVGFKRLQACKTSGQASHVQGTYWIQLLKLSSYVTLRDLLRGENRDSKLDLNLLTLAKWNPSDKWQNLNAISFYQLPTLPTNKNERKIK